MSEPRSRPPDLAWEALVKATGAMPDMERGALNVALKAIRAQCDRDGLHPDEVPLEIERRAVMYQTAFPQLMMTPTALAKHWIRCLPKPKQETLPEQLARIRAERTAQ